MENEIVLRLPEIGDNDLRGRAAVISARLIQVTDREEHEYALGFIVGTKKAEKVITDQLDPMIADANRAHKRGTKLRRELCEPWQQARAIVSEKVTAYERNERARVAQEQVRAQALADAVDPAFAPVIRIEPELAQVEGMSSREVYKAEVVNMAELVDYVAANKHWQMRLLVPDMSELNAVARSQRDAFNIPGCRLVKETVRSVRL